MHISRRMTILAAALLLAVVAFLPKPAFAAEEASSLIVGSHLTTQDESDTNGNPYPKYNYTEGVDISCTWYAWDQVYSKHGISLPKWGNGGDWYDAAAADPSYEVGSTPLPGSLAIYNGYDEWGHVEYVTAVNGTSITVNTGGWYGEGWRNSHATKEGLVKSGVVGQGNLRGYIYLVQENPMAVSASDKSLKASTVKSAAKKVSPFAVAGAVGAVTFADEGSSKQLSVNSDGKVTVKKGTPAGTYTAKATVKAAGDSRYKEKAETVEARIQVVSPPSAPSAASFKTNPLAAGFKASWGKAKRADGYEIAYASAKEKSKGWQTAEVGDVSSKRVTGLKQEALYTVKIRSFAQAIDGKKYYSGWGAVSNVKTKKALYKIAFKANGGKGSMAPQAIQRGKKTALSANKFTRSGYKFAGWNTKKDGTGKSYKNKAKVKNLAKTGKTVKLYAQWKKTSSTSNKPYVSSRYGTVTVDGKTFKCDYNSNTRTYTLSVTENGRTRVLATNTHYMLVTNGTYLYYGGDLSEISTKYQIPAFNVTLYRMKVDTGKKTRIARGVNLAAFACNGTYLYYGAHASETEYPSTLYVKHLASGKTKLIGKGISGSVCCTGKKLYASTPSMNGPARVTYSFNLNGSGKKVVARNAYLLKPTNSSIVLVYSNASNPPKYRAYLCSINGKKKKALSGWTTDLYGLMSKYSS